MAKIDLNEINCRLNAGDEDRLERVLKISKYTKKVILVLIALSIVFFILSKFNSIVLFVLIIINLYLVAIFYAIRSSRDIDKLFLISVKELFRSNFEKKVIVKFKEGLGLYDFYSVGPLTNSFKTYLNIIFDRLLNCDMTAHQKQKFLKALQEFSITYYDKYASKSTIFRIAPRNVPVEDYKIMIDSLLKLDKIVPRLRTTNINNLDWKDKLIRDFTDNLNKAVEELRPSTVVLSGGLALLYGGFNYFFISARDLNGTLTQAFVVGAIVYTAFRFNKQQ